MPVGEQEADKWKHKQQVGLLALRVETHTASIACLRWMTGTEDDNKWGNHTRSRSGLAHQPQSIYPKQESALKSNAVEMRKDKEYDSPERVN